MISILCVSVTLVVKGFPAQAARRLSDSGRPQAILFENFIKCTALVRRFPVRVFTLLVLCAVCIAQGNSSIPPEGRYKSGYINSAPRPSDFTSAMLWGIAIADTRVPGYEKAQVEIARTQVTGRVDGKDFILNDDSGNVRGGLYRRLPVVRHRHSRPHAACLLERSRCGDSPGRQSS
jgi:hypothetical protein